MAQPGQLVIVENPEAHLHPAAQSKLVELLLRLSLTGVQVIVESHSDHVLNSLRVATAEKLISPGEIGVLYFERYGDKQLQSITIDSSGMIDLKEWPEGFFDQTERDFERLFRN